MSTEAQAHLLSAGYSPGLEFLTMVGPARCLHKSGSCDRDAVASCSDQGDGDRVSPLNRASIG